MIRLLLVFALAFIIVGGPASASDHTGTLKKIQDSGTIVIGHRDASRPFSYLDEKRNPTGYSIDLCLRIVEAVKQKLGRTDLAVKFVPVTAEDRFDRVADGTIDIECGNSTNTLSRQETVDFSNTIFITGAAILARAGSNINGVGDLAGKTVSVVAGTTTERALEDRLTKGLIDAKVVKVKDHDEGMASLEKGSVSAHVADQLILIGLLRASADPSKYVLAPELFSYEPYALALRRNDADFRLVANRALAQLYRSGEIAGVYDKWFGDWGGKPSRLLLAMFALNGLPE
jgi:ABC-type amino acid transport substrate-binding protein